MVPTTYSSLLRMLYSISLYSPAKLGLDNMTRLNEVIGNPLRRVPIVHVTGTNGKGSVSTKVAKCLETLGMKTGLFTSPHISSFRERIQVNGELVTCRDVETILPQLFEACQRHRIPATFFELTTALAFKKFQQAQCDAVVLEVGMGGRLDATNIVTPVLSVITAIQHDHTKILGESLEQIGAEKAGIIKPGIDVLVGPGCPDIIRRTAISRSAPIYYIEDLLSPEERRYQSSNDDTDLLNTDLAHAAMHRLLFKGLLPSVSPQILSTAPLQAALQVRPICRFECFRVTAATTRSCSPNTRTDDGLDKHSHDNWSRDVIVVLDIAHNVDAMKALVSRTLRQFPKSPVRLVVGMSADKDVKSCVRVVRQLVQGDLSRIHCTAANHPRAIPPRELRQLFQPTESSVPPSSQAEDGLDGEQVSTTLLQALSTSLYEEGGRVVEGVSVRKWDPCDSHDLPPAVVIVCGSAYIMAQARQTLGLLEERDGDDLLATHSTRSPAVDKFADASIDANTFERIQQ